MEITEHTQSELTLTYSQQQRWLPLLALLGLVIGLGGGYLSRWLQFGDLLPETWAIMLAAMLIGVTVTAVLLIFFTIDQSRRHPVTVCRLERETGRLAVERRVAWRLWRPQRQAYSLESVTAVSLQQDGRDDQRLALHLEDGRRLTLAIDQPQGSDNARLARVLAAFLDTPLDLHLGYPDPIRFRPHKETD